jgi:uncharacterized protein with GYD domain
MLFVSFLEIISGKVSEALDQLKHLRVPERIKVVQFLGLFGKPDVVLIFEAANEKEASEFVTQFGECFVAKTLLAFSIGEL